LFALPDMPNAANFALEAFTPIGGRFGWRGFSRSQMVLSKPSFHKSVSTGLYSSRVA